MTEQHLFYSGHNDLSDLFHGSWLVFGYSGSHEIYSGTFQHCNGEYALFGLDCLVATGEIRTFILNGQRSFPGSQISPFSVFPLLGLTFCKVEDLE